MTVKSVTRDFPENFVWGAATCPACCEGETVSDWAKLSAPDGSVPDDGPRHWRRYRYDFRAMAGLGLGAYRFGCDWGRLQRAPYAPLNRDDTLRYLEMLAELRGLGIEPWLVLFQHALPRWSSMNNGWLNPETPHHFADFAARLADATDGKVAHWVTFHEPQVYAFACHAWGVYPGGAWGRLDQVNRSLANMRTGHRLAAAALRRRLPGIKVGLSLPGGGLFPRRARHPGDWLAAHVSDWFLNRFGLGGFLKGEGGCDFLMLGTGNELGVATGDALSLSSGVSASLPKRMRHSGGDMAPSRRKRQLERWLRAKRLPVYLVGKPPETSPDGLRRLLAPYAGGDAGMTADGFFYDPLLDQFDLDRGLSAGGGLLRVDFHSQDRRRELRAFSRVLAGIAKSGSLGKAAQ